MRHLVYKSKVPYHSIFGAFGHFSGLHQLKSIKADLIVELPVVTPAAKLLWKTQSLYHSRVFCPIEEDKVHHISSADTVLAAKHKEVPKDQQISQTWKDLSNMRKVIMGMPGTRVPHFLKSIPEGEEHGER